MTPPHRHEPEGITSIEYSMTVEYKHPRKGSYWIKFGATLTPEDDESPDDARDRLVVWVQETVAEQIAELKQ